MRVARQRAAATLRGDGEQAAGGDGDDGLAAPLSACLKALRVVGVRLYGLELAAAGDGAAFIGHNLLHTAVELQGFLLAGSGRQLQEDGGGMTCFFMVYFFP